MNEITEKEILLNYEEYLENSCVYDSEIKTAFGFYLYNMHEDLSRLNENDWADRFADFEDCYSGCQPFVDYVAEMFLELNEVPAHLLNYIDYESVARDWLLNGDFWTASDGLGNDFIFRSL